MKLFERNRTRGSLILPVIPVRDTVLLPGMGIQMASEKPIGIQAVLEARDHAQNRLFFCHAKPEAPPDFKPEAVYEVGTIGQIIHLQQNREGHVRIIVQGLERARIQQFTSLTIPLRAQIKPLEENLELTDEVAALMRLLREEFLEYARNAGGIPPKVKETVEQTDSPLVLFSSILHHLPLPTATKAALLALEDPREYLSRLGEELKAEQEVLSLRQEITARVKRRMEQSQKEYVLQEQLKEIQRQLGKDVDDPAGLKDLEERLKAKVLPDEVQTKAERELDRLKKLQPLSPEAGVLRTYLEWIVDLPWTERTTDSKDIRRAQEILDEDHYDLVKVKERILEFIAVRQLSEESRGPILCFVGPPGTGKTSLGRSLARALGRNFVRMSLGGVRDEAEIRGHRKTYVAALPGKIIQTMKKAGSINPVFLLDEIDKMSSDFRGDPASALLEVLDPEQNHAFVDHYLEVPYDLSHVMFVTTANSLHTIPYPLRDRMEIIEVSGYSDVEKFHIAVNHLIPRQQKENGLDWAAITFRREAVYHVIHHYTLESGVRELDRTIGRIMRKIATEVVEKKVHPEKEGRPFSKVITAKAVERYLGPPRIPRNTRPLEPRVGLAYGLAWTELGGRLLPVEAVSFEGRGDLILTGSLGDVMKESAFAGLSFLKAHARSFNLNDEIFSRRDIHIHVPEGAIPKDGPSAGITLTAAMLSVLTGIPPRHDVAITGEITLTGRILPVGGIKEKVLAAHRHDIPSVLLPKENEKDLTDVPREVRQRLSFVFVESLAEALAVLFPETPFTLRT
ncbi:endopeptidase La [Spirochaeta thermophila]|uniref:Lon protease n=1 Tax=Winmispira thermophila (strain ATCC 49972 / DSM 6192 / RI 19.B1) TaxID=665571 RepID=E0RQP2_WINT6|nr:endopeptidase La [Spirochaeta thermophila]ADN01546.1 ATP-dependent protease La [Spirochaeta thermophila DSM 6192]